MNFAEYRRYDALGLAELVATKQVKPSELLELARARAAAVNNRINAIVRYMPVEADARVAADLEGPFAGVPFLLKDLGQNYAGVPTSQGSRSLANLPASEHATVVQRWLDAGLVIFGKTNTPEFGAKGITEPDAFGPCRNPWNLDRSAGGSSGGAAAAVAAGIVPVAGASDGGGSIRIPAACCGLVGLKPSRGLIPTGPLVGDSMHGAAVQGVLSRSVRDTAAMLDALKGADPTSPFLPAIPEGTFLSQVGTPPGRLRIGVYVPTAISPNPHAEASAAIARATSLLIDLGHSVEVLTVRPFNDATLAKDFLLSWFVHCAVQVEQAKRLASCGDEGFERDTLVMAALGRATSGVEYLGAVQRRHDYVRQLAAYYQDHDLLMTPTLAKPAPRIGELDLSRPLQVAVDILVKTRTAGLLRHTSLLDQMIEANFSWVPYTQMANLTGRPAISLPLHWTAEGMPMGVQLNAQLGGESMLLQLAAQLEESAPWAHRYPPL